MRLIDADALQAIFNDVSTSLLGKAELCKDTEHMVRAFIMTTEMIRDAKTVDAALVVHGHWIWHEDSFEYECSACKCRFDYNHTFDLFDHGYQYANYCPNCGAQMGADVEWIAKE